MSYRRYRTSRPARRAVALVTLAAAGFVAAATVAQAQDTATTDTTHAATSSTETTTGSADTISGQTTTAVTTTTPNTTTSETSPSDPPAPMVIADGVTIAGVAVGGMTADEATAAVRAFFVRPLAISFRRQTWQRPPARLGAVAVIDGAVAWALLAAPGETVRLPVRVDRPRLRAYARRVDRRSSVAVVNAQVRLRALRPHVTKARRGYDIQARRLFRMLRTALKTHARGPLRVPYRVVRPTVTRRSIGPVIVIRRESKRLLLYRGNRLRRSFRVATGLPSYPTPLGRFTIVTKQRHPWWYPPSSDWAQGLSPVPPGPGNPLGTRWMGLSRGGIGIHGTPDAASVGYSASHGCIRMLIRDAEWLFERVRVGTTVFIVAA